MRRRTVAAASEQSRVIAALLASGDTRVAARLQRCMSAMTTRRQGAGWPWMCRGSGGGCVWCRQALGRRWWRGLRHWIMEGGEPVSLAVLPVARDAGGLRHAVARLRRACRDVRDRAARRRASWRSVALAGMAMGDAALLLIRHPGIRRQEVAAVLEARWPDVSVGDVGAAEPSWTLATADAAELARIRRGVEPLRIIVLAQHAAAGALNRDAVHGPPVPIEPMPTLV